MFEEFTSLAGTISQEELDVIASQVIAGLEKIAAEGEDVEEDDSFTKSKLIAGAAAGAAGTAYLAHKLPEWKYDRAIGAAAKSRNKQRLYEQKYNENMRAADAALGGLYGSRGLGSAPGSGHTGYSSGGYGWDNKNRYKEMKDPNKRVSSEINGESRKPGDVGSDVAALKAKDFLTKNKMPILAGGGVAAYMALNKNDKDKLESELRGSYSNGAGRGRFI